MSDRRNFIRQVAGATGLAAFSPFIQTLQGRNLVATFEKNANRSADEVVSDEDFWFQIQQAYTVSPSIINLNNGGVSPQPRIVQEAVEHYNRLCNDGPSHFMWRVLDTNREIIRNRLAEIAGCPSEELAINRNTTEALANVIFGLRLKAGDEVVLTKQDYPNMINAWKQREKRDGIVLKWLSFDFPIEDNSLIISEFEKAFTSKTKVVHITHLINWSGQLLPVKEIAQAAHRRGIEVLVDAAHSFGQFDFKIPDLDCDYLGTSLHKWLCAPLGSGLLYVKKDKIKNLYPLTSAGDPESEDIRKFENLGTRMMAIEHAIIQAVNFHQMIGAERKQKRLFYLKKYWTDKVLELPGVKIGTSAKPEFSGAIALLQIEGKTPLEVSELLYGKFRIHTVSIDWENIHGVRITPNVYTSILDLDRLVAAISEIAKT